MQLEVDAMQAEAASARAAAESRQAAVLEVERLGQDNALLAARLSQMDLDLQVRFLLCRRACQSQPDREPCFGNADITDKQRMQSSCYVWSLGRHRVVSQRTASGTRCSTVLL